MKHLENNYPVLIVVALSFGAFVPACSQDNNSGAQPGAQGGTSAQAGSDAGGSPAAAGALSVGGSGGAPGLQPFTPQVAFDFDFLDDGTTYGWTTMALTSTGSPCPNATTAGTLEVIDADSDPNNATPGALQFDVEFPPYVAIATSAAGVTTAVACDAYALFTYGDAASGTTDRFNGATTLRFSVRLISDPPAADVDSYQPYIQGGALSGFQGGFGFVDVFDPNDPTATMAPGLADDGWHDVTVDLSGAYASAVPYTADVWRIGFIVKPDIINVMAPAASDAGMIGAVDAGGLDGGMPGAAGAGPGAMPDLGTPAPVTIQIDNVSLE